MTTSTASTDQNPYYTQDRHAAASHGWRPSTARPCPRVAAGLRCLAGGAKQCICERSAVPMVRSAAVAWLVIADSQRIETVKRISGAAGERRGRIM